jgi:cytoskeletal protein RodZ
VGREIRGVPEAAPLEESHSIGSYLRRQRSLRGIELDELAAATRIPRRSLERLEAGEFDFQPDGFARGFVRAVATALGLDAEDAVARMRPEATLADEPLPRRLWPWVLSLICVAVLALAGLWLSADREAEEAAAPDVVIRRDPVRALADDAD